VLEPSLLAFVRASIPSIWALELLLLLRRAAPGSLRRDEIVQLLRATPLLIDRLIDQFTTLGLVKEDANGARFECSSAETETLCEALAMASETRPLALRDAIISAPNEKLRDLADAFRFKNPAKEPKGGPEK
jgi:hypothetical protein